MLVDFCRRFKRRRFAFRKAMFYVIKGYLLQAKRPPFGTLEASGWKSGGCKRACGQCAVAGQRAACSLFACFLFISLLSASPLVSRIFFVLLHACFH